MSRLHDLFDQVGQSPWLDNPSRSCLRSGRLAEWLDRGVRGISATPTLFERVFADMTALSTGDWTDPTRLSAEDRFWELTIGDIVDQALARLRPLYEHTEGRDGFAVIGLPPGLAGDGEGAVTSARALHQQIHQPNLMVAIPASDTGIGAIRRLTADGIGVNPTRIFSLRRYEQVIEAYISGLEVCPGDLTGVHSVASFPLGELDSTVDAELGRFREPEALALRGRIACAVARSAYRLFRDGFSGPRWDALAHRGANVQRPLWVATPPGGVPQDTRYSEALIGPDTISSMPEDVLAAFEDHGKVVPTLESRYQEAGAVVAQLRELGVDLDLLTQTLEDVATKAHVRSYNTMLAALKASPHSS